jgi:hypothetical protein
VQLLKHRVAGSTVQLARGCGTPHEGRSWVRAVTCAGPDCQQAVQRRVSLLLHPAFAEI